MNNILEMKYELQGSLLKFTCFFYKLLTGRDFIVSQPTGRESHHLTICKALTKAARLELESQRLIINTPPGEWQINTHDNVCCMDNVAISGF